MAFFKSILCCSSDSEDFSNLNALHLHSENFLRYQELLESKQEDEITPELLKDASKEVATRFEQLSENYLALLQMHDRKMTEDVKGKIRTTCGMSKLLVKEKLYQFDQLVENYEAQNIGEENNGTLSSSGTKLVKLDDLKSFFELISVQVGDLDSMYEELKRLRDHGWNDVPSLSVSDGELFVRKESKSRLIIEPPAPTKTAQADLQRREQQRAELRKIMKTQAAEGKGEEEIVISIYEGKKLN